MKMVVKSAIKGEKEMKSTRMLPIVSTLILASLVIASCSSLQSANFPSGTFIKSGEQNYGLVFNADKTFSVVNGSATLVAGTYKIEGSKYIETSNNGGCETNVGFTYVFDGKNLTFNYIGDPEEDKDCTGRYADFYNVTYTLAE
jgi:hypothetical protein